MASNEEVQESFDNTFPEHKGHSFKKVCVITDLCAPFVCSCGETLRITIAAYLSRPEAVVFYDYLMERQREFSEEYNKLSNAAFKLGYMLVESNALAKLIERANLKEGESI